jgi:hypothetical protein
MTTATTRASGTIRVHPESASQMISSRLWIIPREARSQRHWKSSRSSCRRNAHGIQVPIMRQLIATTSGGHSAIPVVARRTRSKWTKKSEDDDQGDQAHNAKFQDASKTFKIIFGGDGDFGSRREQKLLLQEIMSVEPAAPRPLRWSEVPISFSRDDQWTSFSEPGKFPLVLDPMVAEVRLTKVLIDGGSGLNLIFASTLDWTSRTCWFQASLLSTALF